MGVAQSLLSDEAARYIAEVNADYDQCLPRRLVTVFKVVGGPDKRLGAVRTGSADRAGAGTDDDSAVSAGGAGTRATGGAPVGAGAGAA